MSASFIGTTARMTAGGLVWVLHFAVIYGVTALACARGAAHIVGWTIGIATIAAVAALGAIFLVSWKKRAFEGQLASGLAAVALLAVLFEASGFFLVPTCG